ncbi:MAG TPA: hypothetical protein VJP07_06390 [Dehalococcoidia bacterium]|nr:hypothetical protein [Dehalococcoidia bacterium]
MSKRRWTDWGAAALAALAAGAGCASLGPASIVRDRVDYSESIADSWKRQTLTNILRLRYMDTPIFLDVSSVVASYGVGANVGANANVNTQGSPAVPSVGVSGAANWASNPTITYVPLTGSKFLRGLLDPVPPSTVLYLIQVGYPADFILELGVESIGGLRNRSDHAGEETKADPEFLRLAMLLRRIQERRGIALRVEDTADKQQTVTFLFRREALTEEAIREIAEVKDLPSLARDRDQFKLVFSPVRTRPDELAVNSRSMLQMMGALATFVDVPERDVAEGRATRAPDTRQWLHPLLRVSAGAAPPDDAFVSVQYRNHWFWIDDRDWRSKRTFSTVLFMFTLADTDVGARLPVITIPVR